MSAISASGLMLRMTPFIVPAKWSADPKSVVSVMIERAKFVSRFQLALFYKSVRDIRARQSSPLCGFPGVKSLDSSLVAQVRLRLFTRADLRFFARTRAAPIQPALHDSRNLRRMHSVESALARLLFVLRISPSPIEPEIRVSFRQA